MDEKFQKAARKRDEAEWKRHWGGCKYALSCTTLATENDYCPTHAWARPTPICLKKNKETKEKTERKVNGYTKRTVAAQQNWKCGICTILLPACFEVDHIKALFQGGTNDLSNLMALCRNCHGDKTFRERM